ncbi:hypothetical protein NYE69_06900 [Paenibacillus sp. FSL R5-0527]|uniref:hypothetical protein n=1 Tax=Paenibacillus sp. FSL R5-0527 TaxID=2975321 RepID=UPI00097B9D4A|nr:hypothetical protein BK140_09300 [Paenibacillus macerans]
MKDEKLYEILDKMSSVLLNLNRRVSDLEMAARKPSYDTEIINHKISEIQIGINELFGVIPNSDDANSSKAP